MEVGLIMMASRFLKSQRMTRSKRAFPISSFSIFLLGFGLIFWIIQAFTLLPNYECRYGIIWIGGWFDNTSLFQTVAALISLITILFVVRLFCQWKGLNVGETVFQAAMVATFVFVLTMHKAFLIPQATPTWDQVVRAVSIIPHFKFDIRLEEEAVAQDIQYEGFPPPHIEFTEDPRYFPEYNRRLSTIFVRKTSPLWSEYKALEQCEAEMVRALAQWEKDQLALEQYWDDYWARKVAASGRAEASN